MQKVLGSIQILGGSALLGIKLLGLGIGGLALGLTGFCLFFASGLQAIYIGHRPTNGMAACLSMGLTFLSASLSCQGFFNLANLSLGPSHLWTTLIPDLVIFGTMSLATIHSLVLACCFFIHYDPDLDEQGEGQKTRTQGEAQETRIHMPPTPSPLADELPPSYNSLFANKWSWTGCRVKYGWWTMLEVEPKNEFQKSNLLLKNSTNSFGPNKLHHSFECFFYILGPFLGTWNLYFWCQMLGFKLDCLSDLFPYANFITLLVKEIWTVNPGISLRWFTIHILLYIGHQFIISSLMCRSNNKHIVQNRHKHIMVTIFVIVKYLCLCLFFFNKSNNICVYSVCDGWTSSKLRMLLSFALQEAFVS